jgi:O-antigen/teichoic acid export membrane protein
VIKHLWQLAKESLVYGLGDIVTRFITVFLVPIYTRIFTPSDYGVLSLVSTTMNLVSIFVVLGLDSAAHRWFWDGDDLKERKTILASWTWCQFAVATVCCVLIYEASGKLGRLIVGSDAAGLYFRIAAFTVPLGVLNLIMTGWLRMHRRPWATTFFFVTTTLVNIAATIVLVIYLHKGIAGIFIAQVISMAVASVIAAIALGDWVNPLHVRPDRLRQMLRYSLPMVPGGLAVWVLSASDRYFVTYYTNTTEVGLYSIGGSLAAVVALGTMSFQTAWNPFAFSIHKDPGAKDVYANALLIYTAVTCFICTAVGLFAPEAIMLVATKKYLGAQTVVGLLSISYVVVGLRWIAATGPQIVKNSRSVGIAAFLGAVLNIAFNFALVPSMGKLGSALATLLSQIVVSGYLFYEAQKLYRIPYRFGATTAMFAISLALMGAGSFLHVSNIFAGIAAKLGILLLFVPCIFLLRVITPSQTQRVFSMVASRS